MELLHGNLQLGDKIILQDFSLSLPSQGVLCLSGPSGCGKTSLLRVLAGLTPLSSGSITHMLDSRMVFQEDRLIPWLSVEANLTAASGISQAEARRWLQLCGLEQEYHARPGSLSGGMRRRVAIVRALAAPSQLLLLDEPAAGMNPSETAELTETIRRIRDEFNIAVLLIEHDMSLVMGICEGIAVLNFGRIIAKGTPDEIRNNPQVIEAYLGKKEG